MRPSAAWASPRSESSSSARVTAARAFPAASARPLARRKAWTVNAQRSINSAMPGAPAGNIENSFCTTSDAMLDYEDLKPASQ